MADVHGPWRIESRSEKYRNAFLRLEEDQVRTPDGAPGAYATVSLKPGVAVLAIDDEGAVHLTEQFRYALGRKSLEVVSGTVEAGEDPITAARRELEEELGIVANQWTDQGVVDLDTSIVRCPVRLFTATGLRFTAAHQDSSEDIRRRTMSLEAAVALVMDSRVTHAPSCVLLLKARIAAAQGRA